MHYAHEAMLHTCCLKSYLQDCRLTEKHSAAVITGQTLADEGTKAQLLEEIRW